MHKHNDVQRMWSDSYFWKSEVDWRKVWLQPLIKCSHKVMQCMIQGPTYCWNWLGEAWDLLSLPIGWVWYSVVLRQTPLLTFQCWIALETHWECFKSIINPIVTFRLAKVDFKWLIMSLVVTILCRGEKTSRQKYIWKQQMKVDSYFNP